MRLLDYYNAAIVSAEITDDLLQREVIEHLQRVADELAQPSSWFRKLLRHPNPVIGLYLYGPVGAGKTYLMDLFYQGITEKKKARFHFHHFMQQIDAQLRRLQGKKDPIKQIAMNFAKTTRLLCLDEFLVHDVADAMILAELLHALFAQQVVIVATGNTPPDDLYLHGVHRERFLPAIALLKQYCEIFKLSEVRDYRLGRMPQMQAYLYPLNEKTTQAFNNQFDQLAGPIADHHELCIQQRMVEVVKWSGRTVWFEFDIICNLPRCQLDYLEIAERFDTIFVSNISVLGINDSVKTILLVHFIDVMYDRGVRLILSAAVPAQELYPAGPMLNTFKRTLSRLEEMQSMDYLQRNNHRVSTSQL